MKAFSFKKIDAFTDGRSCGNPAGAIYSDAVITDDEMQRIAYELRGFVSETVFIFPPDDGTHDYHLRYFSCEREVPFCGHGTIAVMYDLLFRDASSPQHVRIRTMKGVLSVENRIADENAVYIAAPEPVYYVDLFDKEELAFAMNLSPDRISPTRPVTMVNAGQNVLIIPLETIGDVTGASPDYETIRAYCLAHKAEVINIWTPDTRHRENRYRTRVFAPTFGYLEDPATGSGNAALAYHLKQSQEWNGTPFSIEQGSDRENPNIIKVIWKDDRVYFGGSAMVRIEGKYFLS